MRVPLYHESGSTYRADTCRPLEAAVAAGKVELQALVHGHYPGRCLPRQALPGVKTIGFWDAQQGQDWGLDWHRNEGLELTWLERGCVDFALQHAAFRLRPDDLTITRPWQQHRVGDPHVGAGRLHWLILDVGVRRPHQPWTWPGWVVLTKDDVRELTTGLRLNEQPVWPGTAELGQCFQRISGAVARDRNGDSVSLLAALLNELLVHVLGLFRQRHVDLDERLASSQRTVELFWADLREHLEDLASEWTVERMARRCGLGTTHFIHLTKRLFNLTPGHYLNVCRLKAAAELLVSQPDLSIGNVSAACGFSSSRYFATLFGRHFHSTPSDLRRRSSLAPAAFGP
jgi:AraC family L-rhamnose operon regulatory protein RhaS